MAGALARTWHPTDDGCHDRLRRGRGHRYEQMGQRDRRHDEAQTGDQGSAQPIALSA